MLLGLLEAEAQATLPQTLLSSLVAASKLAVVGTTAGAAAIAGGGAGIAGTQVPASVHLAEGVMQMIFWAKIKFAATVLCAVAVVGGVGVPAAVNLLQAEETGGTPKAVVEDKDAEIKFRRLAVDQTLFRWATPEAAYRVCRNPSEAAALPIQDSRLNTPDSPQNRDDLRVWSKAQTLDSSREMVAAVFHLDAGGGKPSLEIQRVMVVGGEVHVECAYTPADKRYDGGMHWLNAIVAFPARNLPVVFYENGKEVARAPFNAATNGNKDAAAGEIVNGLRLVLKMDKEKYADGEAWNGSLRLEATDGRICFDRMDSLVEPHLERVENGKTLGTVRRIGNGRRMEKDRSYFSFFDSTGPSGPIQLAGKESNPPRGRGIELMPFQRNPQAFDVPLVFIMTNTGQWGWDPSPGVYRFWFTCANKVDEGAKFDIKEKVWTGEMKSNVVTVVVGGTATVGEKEIPEGVSQEKGGKAMNNKQNLATFTRQLTDLVKEGNSLVKSLTIVAAKKEGDESFKTAATAIEKDLCAGLSLAAALSKQPALFDAAYVAAIREGERTRTLELALEKLAESLDKAADAKQDPEDNF
jgi:hypothetical protein